MIPKGTCREFSKRVIGKTSGELYNESSEQNFWSNLQKFAVEISGVIPEKNVWRNNIWRIFFFSNKKIKEIRIHSRRKACSD